MRARSAIGVLTAAMVISGLLGAARPAQALSSLPPRTPFPRFGEGVAYDEARGELVLLDMWPWNGRDWSIPFPAALSVQPRSEPPGGAVDVSGWRFGALQTVDL